MRVFDKLRLSETDDRPPADCVLRVPRPSGVRIDAKENSHETRGSRPVKMMFHSKLHMFRLIRVSRGYLLPIAYSIIYQHK